MQLIKRKGGGKKTKNTAVNPFQRVEEGGKMDFLLEKDQMLSLHGTFLAILTRLSTLFLLDKLSLKHQAEG